MVSIFCMNPEKPCKFMSDFDIEGSFLFFLELFYMSGWEKTTRYQVRMQEHVERTEPDFWCSICHCALAIGQVGF